MRARRPRSHLLYNERLSAGVDAMIDEVEARLAAAFADAQISVTGEGNRVEVRVVSAEFEGLSRVKRQQAVYRAIREMIDSGAIHAVTIKASAPGDPP